MGEKPDSGDGGQPGDAHDRQCGDLGDLDERVRDRVQDGSGGNEDHGQGDETAAATAPAWSPVEAVAAHRGPRQ